MSLSPRPALTLAAIVALISALLIVTYNATYVDTSNILTDKQSAAAVAIYGGTAEDYEVVPEEAWRDALSAETDPDFAGITKVIRSKTDGSLAYEAVVKGYKKGFDILVGVKDGAVENVAIVSVGEETPGLGTKTNDPAFLGQFRGKTGEVTVVKTAPGDNEIQAVTSATFSSKGVAKAVNIALKAYEKFPSYEKPVQTTDGGEQK